MAKIDNEYCVKCNKRTIHINGRCSDCEGKSKSLARRKHFGALDAMTIEERLRRIEEWHYDFSCNPPWVEPTY